ncbi:MAG: GNAT family N-acetyltransferase [Chloroflexales bacterium]|nr:GNAT family N-acetyltransferase [Chloroflexales bacterium]
MNDLIQDLATAESIAAQEANMKTYWSAFGRTPNQEVYDRPKLLRFMSGIPDPNLNGVVYACLPPDILDETIIGTRAYFETRQLPMLWWVGPGTRPASLGQHLKQHGFAFAGEAPMMAFDVSMLPKEQTLPAQLSIAAIDNEAALREWSRIIAISFGLPDAAPDAFFELETSFGIGSTPSRQRLIGYHDNALVATATLLFAAGVAGIYTIAVQPEARGQGFGAAITLAALYEARKRGYRVATLQSTPMGYPVYQRLGFQDVAVFECYHL